LNIPQPNILPVEKGDEEAAKMLEGMLTYKINRPEIERIVDENERIVKKASICWYKVSWNPNVDKHTFKGEIEITNPHPKNVIPQPGVYRVQDMDYLFHIENRTVDYVARRYGRQFKELLEDESAEYEYLEQPSTESSYASSTETNKVSVVECWYKDEDGDVCLLTWANDVILRDIPKFYYKRDEQGNIIEREEITIVDELGNESAVTVPAYIPRRFPLVPQYNIPKDKSLYGKSDPEIIKDQQEGIKKILSIEEEKLIKGTTKIFTNDETLKAKLTNAVSQVIYAPNFHEGSIKAVDLKTPDNSYKEYFHLLYQAAKDVLGIQDAWVGKAPSDIRSGVALRQLAQNAASRINTKVNGKRLAFKELYQVMIDFMLAFYEEDRPYRILGSSNQYEYGMFSRAKILRADDAGQYFYPEFDIMVDVSEGIPRDKMWTFEAAKELFAAQAMNDIDLWTILEDIGFPKAGEIKERHIEMRGQQQGGQPVGSEPLPAEQLPAELPLPEGGPPAAQGNLRDMLVQLVSQFPTEQQGQVVEVIQNMPDDVLARLMSAPLQEQVAIIQEAFST